MRKFLLSVFTAVFALTASAADDELTISIKSGSTPSSVDIEIGLNNKNNVQIMDGTVVIPEGSTYPLTSKGNLITAKAGQLAERIVEEETGHVLHLQFNDPSDKTRLYMAIPSPDGEYFSGTTGTLCSINFNASALADGKYEVKLENALIGYSALAGDCIENINISCFFEKNGETITPCAAPITAPVTIFKAGATIDVGPVYTPNASYDITTEYTPVENSLLITDDANGKNIPGNNVVYKEDGVYKCKNLVIDDAYGFYSPVDFTAENVTYNRSIDPGKDYITICLPFAVSKENLIGGQPGALAGLDGTDLTFSGVTTTVAYQPYLLKINGQSGAVVADAGLTNVAIVATPDPSDDDMSNIKGGVTHYGQMSFYDYNHEDAPETDFYAFAAIDNRFHRVKLLHVPAFRTVIWLGHSDAGVGLKSTDMSSLGIKFIDGDVPTGAEVVEAEAGKVNVFDALGRAVRLNVDADKATEGLKDGIYIVNGQKVIVKNK